MTRQRIAVDDIEFIFSSHISAREFDKEVASAGFSHGMKSVDVIFDLPDSLYFVELKDPDNPKGAGHPQSQEWIQAFISGGKDTDFCDKFLDTFIYEWASGNLNKPVHYFVIIGMSNLDSALLLTRNNALDKMRPFKHPKCNCHPINQYSCSVHSIESFNNLLTSIQVKRLSAAP